jgi:hypothetical protein
VPLALPATSPPIMPPIRLELVPALLRRRGGRTVSLDRLREAAAAGWIPATRRAGEKGYPAGGWWVAEADLDAIEAYFRGADEAPALPAYRQRAGAVGLALARGAGTVRR